MLDLGRVLHASRKASRSRDRRAGGVSVRVPWDLGIAGIVESGGLDVHEERLWPAIPALEVPVPVHARANEGRTGPEYVQATGADIVCLGNEEVCGLAQRRGKLLEATQIERPFTKNRRTRRRYPRTVGAAQAAGGHPAQGMVRDISCEHDRTGRTRRSEAIRRRRVTQCRSGV